MERVKKLSLAISSLMALHSTLAFCEGIALPPDFAEPRIAQNSEPIPAPANAPTAKAFTLAEAEAAATAFHPALRAAAARVQAAHGNWVQVGLKPNPELGYSGNEIGNEGRAGQQGGFVSQEFVTGGKLGLNRAVALREQAEAEQRVELTRWQVLTTVRKSYFELLAAERSLTLAHQLNGIAAQSVNVSERRLKAMDVPKTSLLQSQIESESAALLEQQAIERVSAARRRLTAVTGSCEEASPLEDVFTRPLPDLDFDAVCARMINDSPEVAELRFAVDRARWAVERAKAGRRQNVNVQGGVQYDNATDDTIANLQMSMPIPVYNRNQGAIAQACGDLAAAQAALEARQVDIQQRLAAALRDYKTARERVSKYTDKILPAAKETLDLINTGYQQGELDYTQVYNVQQTYAAKNLSYLQDLQTAWQKWAEIDGFLVGELSPEPTVVERANAANVGM
jgi:cobalt-zinc-cadmium efflux system outer membrane protein